MTRKLLLVFALAGLAVASAKNFTIILSSPSKVGNTTLQAGQYRLAVEGSQAVFTDSSRQKAAEVGVKVETATKKFQATEVETSKANGTTSVDQIHLGGTTTILKFAN
jgi:hypothetical protein